MEKSGDGHMEVIQIFNVGPRYGEEFEEDGVGIEEWGKLRDLDGDMITEVFSYLPQKERIEVMLLSKHWEKAMKEGHVRWQKVEVVRKWDMEGYKKGYSTCGGVGNETLLRVLESAKGIIFSRSFESGSEYIMSVGGVLRQNRRCLELPDQCIYPSFYPAMPPLPGGQGGSYGNRSHLHSPSTLGVSRVHLSK